MTNRGTVLACVMVELTACLTGWRTADAQDDPRPADRPKIERDGEPKDFRFPFDGPPPKEGPRKPMVPFRPGEPGFDDPLGARPPRGGNVPGPPDGPPGASRGPIFLPGAPNGPPGMPAYDPPMHKLDMEEFELSRKTTELTMRYRNAPAEEREQVKKELTESVNRHFDVRQERRELQLKRLEEELQRLRESIQARNEAREQIVNRRIAELLGDKDDLSF